MNHCTTLSCSERCGRGGCRPPRTPPLISFKGPPFNMRLEIQGQLLEAIAVSNIKNYRVAEKESNGHRQIPNAATRDPVNFRF
jgi:hypothetical protein